MDNRKEFERVKGRLVELLGTEVAVAKALKTTPQVLYYQKQHSKKPSTDLYIAMLKLLIKKEQLDKVGAEASRLEALLPSRQRSEDAEERRLAEAAKRVEHLSFLGRLAAARDFLLTMDQPLDRPANCSEKEGEMCPPGDTLKGRRVEKVARAFGIGGKSTFYRGIPILDSQIAELMERVEAKQLSVRQGSDLLRLSSTPDEVRRLCRQGKQAVSAFIQQKESEQRSQARPPCDPGLLDKDVLYQSLSSQRAQLRSVQQESQLPLYPLYFELGDTCCDAEGYFVWDIVRLKAQLILGTCMDIQQGLEVLCACGVLEKIQQGHVLYGRMVGIPGELTARGEKVPLL